MRSCTYNVSKTASTMEEEHVLTVCFPSFDSLEEAQINIATGIGNCRFRGRAESNVLFFWICSVP
jgi:hypothetical protein